MTAYRPIRPAQTVLMWSTMSSLNVRKDACELDFLALGAWSTGSTRA